MRNVVKAPHRITQPGPYVFLAGSIEMGTAVDWQTEAAEQISDFTILNPRRDDWDSSWTQDISCDQFREQVEWELDALDLADIVLLYLAPGTKSPISLLELGLYARSSKLIVACPEGFWRRGNVQIVCRRYSVPMYETLTQATERIQLLGQ